ncbi:ABC transporter permease [Galbibacter sp.]|uniref:ABC transporter permease n=1 Tax=Galbibacter sp. TaxID=2918471 RepID=UPI003A8E1C1B
MIRSFLKIAWRNIQANKLFVGLNIAGLAIGLCVCILLFTYVYNELSFDKMYSNSEDIYRVNMETTESYDFETWAEVPNAVGPAIINDIPQVKMMTRLIKDDFGATASLKVGNKNFNEERLYLADSSLFKMFDFNFIEGDGQNVFSKPKSIVISQSTKQRLFGSEDAIGKIISVNNRDSLQVTGIYQDLPKNSMIDCELVYNIMDSWMGTNVYWSNASYETYIQLQSEANIHEVQRQATKLIDAYVEKNDQYFTKFFLQPLTKIHLYSLDLRKGYSSRYGDISAINSLLFLSVLVLLIACINYMNLATANSQKRLKGIGVNKILGANRRQMLSLYYVETSILVFISVLIGYGISFIALPIFENILGTQLSYTELLSPVILLGLIAIWILVTLIAGSYPALSLSGISPLSLAQKSKNTYAIADFVRKGLVVFQFTTSIILIVSVIIIYQQMDFIKNKKLGYNPNGIVAVSVKSAESQQQIENVMRDLQRLPVVKNVSAVQSIPGKNESGRSVRKLSTDVTGMPIQSCRTSGMIVETLQLNLLAGNPLPKNIKKGDSIVYTLINEKIVKYLGYKSSEDAIGKYVNTELGNRAVITGVVENFNYNSLKEDIGGYMYYRSIEAPESLRNILIRYHTTDLPEFMEQLQNSFTANLPNTAFDYQFLDTYVEGLYVSEAKTAKTVSTFSLLAIFIACLGLFGLATFMAESRTKEIGVRKVLGASISGIASLLTKDFLKIVLIAFIIAIPFAYWIMYRWLLGFSYRIDIHWWVFLIAGLVAVFIALLTVSFQAINAAVSNPIKSLRTE